MWDSAPVQSSPVLVHLTSLVLNMPHMDLLKSSYYICGNYKINNSLNCEISAEALPL